MDTLAFDEQLRALLATMATAGVRNAAQGFSSMVGEATVVTDPQVQLVAVSEIPNLLGGPEIEAVGIYLRAVGDLAGQIMLIIPYAKALEIVDMLLGQPAGTTIEFGSLERSALQEMGNLTGTFFLNAIANITGLESRPSPPAVMVDMVGAIMDIIVATSGGVSEHVLMLQTIFLRDGRSLDCNFWMIPDPGTLELFAQKGLADGR